MHSANPTQTAKPKRSVFRWLVFIVASLSGLFVAAMAIAVVEITFFPEHAAKKLRPTQVHTVIKDLRLAIHSYEIEYNRLPILGATSHHTDIAIRTQGPILPALLGKEASELNPRSIRFFDSPFDSDRRFGLWKDDNEWALRDRWGELYYLILDTNEAKKITNPEFGADQSNPKYAEKCRQTPPPPTLPAEVIIYSSGPDRDPKTWEDNICSWHQ
ncbi:MAG: hypothetical protein IAE77_27165 [Prosthecobacter sp.]|jgi:hypothetical protein|uniref:hypothetical protein n=1 Tax=Prosthecobacter sp. TaxID=1965333 RepID=UPI0019E479CA|nr:hypothetical protein [Prosthecobacter sp.]MBE2287165.1 hypothetical protein [Prosthecobacter sp.]